MADLPYNYVKLNDIEVSQDAPVTESLLNKIGGAANLAIDKQIQSQIFTSNGNFTVPTGVTKLLVVGIGGGGGGGGSGSGKLGWLGLDTDDNIAAFEQPIQWGGYGRGGEAAPLGVYDVTVTPAQVIAVTVGAAGSGGTTTTDGSAGGSSTFGSITFPGGHQGLNGNAYPTAEYDPVGKIRGKASAFGNGGSEQAAGTTGGSAAGASLGAGGAGGWRQDTFGGSAGTAAAGGSGTQGRVTVFWVAAP